MTTPERRDDSTPVRLAVAAIVAALSAATAFVYAPVVSHEFLNFDDLAIVANDPRVTAPLSLSSLAAHFTSSSHGNWLPLQAVSLQISHALHGATPGAYAATNAALHALSSVVLLAALRRMTGAVWRSAFVAGVFALHPLHVESVAWITERKDVLAGLFWMAGLYAYARGVDAPGRVARVAVFGCLLLGLLCKSTLVTFPFALLLLDFWPLGRLRAPWTSSLAERLREKLPLFALVGVDVGVTYATQQARGQMRVGANLSLAARVANAAESYASYVADAFWPTGLAALYPHPYAIAPPGASDLAVAALLGALLVAATAFALAQRRTRPYLAVGWLWFVGTLLPMIGLVQVGLQARADRYTYVPLVGLAIAVGWAASDLAGRAPARRRAVAAAGAAALVAMAAAARAQVAYWSDTIALYERVVAVTEHNGYAHEMLGYEYAARGRDEDAARHFEAAARAEPGRVQSHFGLAVTRARLGRTEEAIAAYRAGLRLQPDKIRAHGELGVLLVREGRNAEALPHLRRAVAALPQDAELQRALAEAESRVAGDGRPTERPRP